MKRSLIALTLAAVASVAFAGSDEYRFNAGEQDGSVSIADAYRFEAGQKDEHQPVA